MDPRIIAHGKLIVRHSTQLKKGEVIGIYANTLSSKLAEAIYREALLIGAHPFIRLSLPSIQPFFFKNANKEQLTRISKLDWAEAREVDARVIIISDSNTRALAGIDPRRIAEFSRARKPVRDYLINNKKWCLTIHPTEALAQEAGMSLEDYSAFVYSALFIDQKDPIREWEKLERKQAELIRRIGKAKQVRIIGEDTDLTFSVKERLFVNSEATQNLPSGEIFTAPVETSTEGKIYFDIPTARDGHLVEGVRLVFRNGKVIEAHADRGEDYLNKMLGTDSGSRRLGEFGIGTNFGIKIPTKEILFDEKIGGTIHLALGSAYKECRGKNVSALHWDLIKSISFNNNKGKIIIDEKELKIRR